MQDCINVHGNNWKGAKFIFATRNRNWLGQWFSTRVQVDPRGPYNLNGGSQKQNSKLRVHGGISVVHRKISFRDGCYN